MPVIHTCIHESQLSNTACYYQSSQILNYQTQHAITSYQYITQINHLYSIETEQIIHIQQQKKIPVIPTCIHEYIQIVTEVSQENQVYSIMVKLITEQKILMAQGKIHFQLSLSHTNINLHTFLSPPLLLFSKQDSNYASQHYKAIDTCE